MSGTSNSNSQSEFQQQRLRSLDAYRGLIMISLSFAGFGLATTAENFLETAPDSKVWQTVQYEFSHPTWVGCSFWDLIQPSFMFMVGASMAYSYAKRKRSGHSYQRMLGHAVGRSIVLILLSLYLMSHRGDHTNWTFANVLAQMGLAYTFLFLLWDRSVWVQVTAGVLVLMGTWIAFESYPNAGIDLTAGAPEVGVSQEWAQENLEGVRPAWHKNANLGHAIDTWFLNIFPREEPFEYNVGGYQTINFIPSLVTMLIGLMCGELLRSDHGAGRKIAILVAAGVIGIVVGAALHLSGVCPLVKRLWTPAWALFSSGLCCLILVTLYAVIDVWGKRSWSFPLIVVGMNSIVVYCMSMTLKPYTAKQFQIHLGEGVFELKTNLVDASSLINPAIAPTIQAVAVGTTFWLILYYLYRHKMFVRI